MPTAFNYHVLPRGDRWAVEREDATRASRVLDSKTEAVTIARRFGRNRRGSVRIHGRDGRIQEERTYGKDPFPPEG